MPIDRDKVARMLAESSRSYREIGRELGVSDWSIRKISRELSGDARPMKSRSQRSDYHYETNDDGVSSLGSWLVFGSVLAMIALALWAATRSHPPIDSSYLDNTSTSEPNQFQGDN